MIVSFNHLRRIKDSLPDGSMQAIANEFDMQKETVQNYFGGANYQKGKVVGLHVEQGPDGGIVQIDDPKIYYKACAMLKKSETVAAD